LRVESPPLDAPPAWFSGWLARIRPITRKKEKRRCRPT
jgi:hypothetical protein